MAPLAAYAGSWGTGSPFPNIDQEASIRKHRSGRMTEAEGSANA
jgi:hypothetical protein